MIGRIGVLGQHARSHVEVALQDGIEDVIILRLRTEGLLAMEPLTMIEGATISLAKVASSFIMSK